MTTRPFIARLDDMARLTGIPAFAEGKPRRRRMRFLSTGVLLAAAIGYGIIVLGAPLPAWRSFGLGYGLLVVGLAGSNLMPLFGPVKPWGGAEPVDERDRLVRSRAYLGAMTLLALTAIGGLIGLSTWSVLQGWPMSRLQSALIMLALLLHAMVMAGPACFASWAEPAVTIGDE